MQPLSGPARSYQTWIPSACPSFRICGGLLCCPALPRVAADHATALVGSLLTQEHVDVAGRFLFLDAPLVFVICDMTELGIELGCRLDGVWLDELVDAGFVQCVSFILIADRGRREPKLVLRSCFGCCLNVLLFLVQNREDGHTYIRNGFDGHRTKVDDVFGR